MLWMGRFQDLVLNKIKKVAQATFLFYQQFINIIYSVPQISMLINELPQDHKKMLKFYLDFWIENRKVLLNGKLTAENPEIDYSSARATLNGTEIITPYTNSLVEVLENKAVILNATLKDFVVIKGAEGYKAKVVNCLGETVSEFTIKNTLEEIKVPRAGLIYLSK